MSFWSRLFTWRLKGPFSREEAIPSVEPEVRKHLRELAFNEIVDPYDLVFMPELAVEIAVKHAYELGKDPWRYVADMLSRVDFVYNDTWNMTVRAAIVQYELGLFVKRLSNIQPEELAQSVRMTGVSYMHCIRQSMEEALDELKQINGLLDEMPRICLDELGLFVKRPGGDEGV